MVLSWGSKGSSRKPNLWPPVKIPFPPSRQATLGRINWVGQSLLTSTQKLLATVFSCLLACIGTGQGSGSGMEMALEEPVCQLPTRGLMTTAKPSTMHMQPRKSIEFVVRTANCSGPLVEDSTAASAWGQLSMPMVGAGEHAVALWSGDCLAIAHTLVIF